MSYNASTILSTTFWRTAMYSIFYLTLKGGFHCALSCVPQRKALLIISLQTCILYDLPEMLCSHNGLVFPWKCTKLGSSQVYCSSLYKVLRFGSSLWPHQSLLVNAETTQFAFITNTYSNLSYSRYLTRAWFVLEGSQKCEIVIFFPVFYLSLIWSGLGGVSFPQIM